MYSLLLLCKLTTSLTGLDGYLVRFDEFKMCSVVFLLRLGAELLVNPCFTSEPHENNVSEGKNEAYNEANRLESKIKSSGWLGLISTVVAMITVSS